MHAKIIIPLDTMPEVFPARGHERAHSIDAWSHPQQILLFTDADNVSEVVLAHELAHAWVDLVRGVEDHRVWKDESDTEHYAQVQFIQSFVMDFAVDKLLEEKGFDRLEVKADWEIASMQLRVASQHGYQPPNKREAVYMATHLASCLIEESYSSLPALMADVLPVIRRNHPEVFKMANCFAKAVADNFPTSGENATRAVDLVLEQAFAFTDPGLDHESQMIYVEPQVDWEMDKNPDWLTGQTVRAKCEIGVAMAKLGATSDDTPVMHSRNGAIKLWCERPDGSKTDSMPLEHAVMPPSSDLGRINKMIEEMREVKRRSEEMNKLTGRLPPGARHPNTGPGMPRPSPLIQGPQLPNIPGFPPRTYSPGFARWLTQVRMEEMLAGENAYGYAGNNPTTLIDPDGLSPQLPGPQVFHRPHCPLPPVRVPGMPGSAATCAAWNAFIFRYCNDCLRHGWWYDCADKCNAMASWYYDCCKSPSRFHIPGEYWKPIGYPSLGPGPVIPFWPPPRADPPRRDYFDYDPRYRECMSKAKSDWDRTKCWIAAYCRRAAEIIIGDPPFDIFKGGGWGGGMGRRR